MARRQSSSMAGNCASISDRPSLLDTAGYMDFERVYPAPPETPKAAARYEAIFSKVKEALRPVAAVRRPSSSERRTNAGSPSDVVAGTSAAVLGHSAQRAVEPSGGLPPRPPPLPSKVKLPSVPAPSSKCAAGHQTRRSMRFHGRLDRSRLRACFPNCLKVVQRLACFGQMQRNLKMINRAIYISKRGRVFRLKLS